MGFWARIRASPLPRCRFPCALLHLLLHLGQFIVLETSGVCCVFLLHLHVGFSVGPLQRESCGQAIHISSPSTKLLPAATHPHHCDDQECPRCCQASPGRQRMGHRAECHWSDCHWGLRLTGGSGPTGTPRAGPLARCVPRPSGVLLGAGPCRPDPGLPHAVTEQTDAPAFPDKEGQSTPEGDLSIQHGDWGQCTRL